MGKNKIRDLCINALNSIDSCSDIIAIPALHDRTKAFRQRLNDDEFRVAVVGEFSSGKSTFLNALIGKDILSHATQETTAAITRIVNVSPNDAKCNTGCVFFTDNTEKKLTDLSQLREYTTRTSHSLNVINQVDRVEIYIPILQSSNRLVFIDTPGLNGIAEGYRERTNDLVQKSHACIYLLRKSGISDSDIHFLKNICKYQKNFIFVQNFIDAINAEEGDSVDTKLNELQNVLKTIVFNETSDVQWSICGVSAVLQLCSKDPTVELSGITEDVSMQQRSELENISGFDSFYNIINETYSDKQMDNIRYGDTARLIADWLIEIINMLSEKENDVRELYESSSERERIEKLQKRKELLQEHTPIWKERLSNLVDASSGEIIRKEILEIDEKIKQIQRECYDMLSKVNSINEFNDFTQQELPQKLHAYITDLTSQYRENINAEIGLLEQRVLDQMQQYSGGSVDKIVKQQFTINKAKPFNTDYSYREEELYNERENVRRAEEYCQQAKQAVNSAAEQAKNQEDELETNRKLEKNNENVYNRNLKNINARPEAQTIKVTKTRPHTGFLHNIIDSVFGYEKYETEIEDDSKGEEWDKKRNLIENEYRIKKKEYNAKIAAGERDLERKKARYSEANQRYQQALRDLNMQKDNLHNMEMTYQREKEIAAQQYLENICKKNCKIQIQKYLFGNDETDGIANEFKTYLTHEVKEQQSKIRQWAIVQFDSVIKRRIKEIDDTMQVDKTGLVTQTNHFQEKVDELRQHLQILKGAINE